MMQGETLSNPPLRSTGPSDAPCGQAADKLFAQICANAAVVKPKTTLSPSLFFVFSYVISSRDLVLQFSMATLSVKLLCRLVNCFHPRAFLVLLNLCSALITQRFATHQMQVS